MTCKTFRQHRKMKGKQRTPCIPFPSQAAVPHDDGQLAASLFHSHAMSCLARNAGQSTALEANPLMESCETLKLLIIEAETTVGAGESKSLGLVHVPEAHDGVTTFVLTFTTCVQT
jgi:hypothetical protein